MSEEMDFKEHLANWKFPVAGEFDQGGEGREFEEFDINFQDIAERG